MEPQPPPALVPAEGVTLKRAPVGGITKNMKRSRPMGAPGQPQPVPQAMQDLALNIAKQALSSIETKMDTIIAAINKSPDAPNEP